MILDIVLGVVLAVVCLCIAYILVLISRLKTLFRILLYKKEVTMPKIKTPDMSLAQLVRMIRDAARAARDIEFLLRPKGKKK